MIERLVGGSVRRKLMFVVLTTTMTALVVAGVALLLYDLRKYERSLLADLTAQAEIVARASAPAIQFNDQAAARNNLALLSVRPTILAAALYTASGERFAEWRSGAAADHAFPASLPPAGHTIAGDRVVLVHPVSEHGETLGAIHLTAQYGAPARIQDYLLILAGVLLASLAVAIALSAWLQRAVTRPIRSVSEVARRVMEQRDFSLRATRTSDDEVGYLVDAFNGMLAEVGQRTVALEATNRSLEREMQDRRAAEEALRTADRRKDEFLATLAHELRNPLAPMRNALQILSSRGADGATADRAREILGRQLAQLIRLVDDLLDVSRITTGKLALQTGPVPLAAALQSAIETVRPLAESRGHTLEAVLPGTDVRVEGDATRLAQVFANLLNNACKYTEPGGRVRVEAAVEAGWAAVRITDTGIGIAPDMLGRVFEMFEQADASLERRHGGLGVGLSLARRLVELHGGQITAHSPGLGMGSTFVVRLPRLLRQAQDLRTPPQEPSAPGRPRRVLVVDDNQDFAATLATIMREDGHDVAVAADGHEAIGVAQRHRPEIALLDIGMPSMNGYDLARTLRRDAALTGVVLVAVTGWGQPSDRARSREAGFDHHLVKPVAWDDLRRLLHDPVQRTDAA